MPTFPSREWMQEFCERVAEQPDADRIATALEGTYRFVIEPGGPLEEQHAYDVRIAPGPDIALLHEAAESPSLQLIATHDRWRQLIEGKLDVAMALMMRRLKVRGDLSRLTGRLDSARPLVTALGQVQTQWLDR